MYGENWRKNKWKPARLDQKNGNRHLRTELINCLNPIMNLIDKQSCNFTILKRFNLVIYCFLFMVTRDNDSFKNPFLSLQITLKGILFYKINRIIEK